MREERASLACLQRQEEKGRVYIMRICMRMHVCAKISLDIQDRRATVVMAVVGDED